MSAEQPMVEVPGDGGDPSQAEIRFVAVGDSFTEGVGDQSGAGPRGWADRVAERLAATQTDVPVRYANLAVRGRLLHAIVGEQVAAALALQPTPTLLAINGGGNDMLRPGMNVDTLVELTRDAVQRCVAAGVHVLLLAGADPSDGLPFTELIRRRGALLTERIAPLRESEGVTYVDAFNDVELRRPVYWSPDRLHLNAAGHQRVAGLVWAALREDAGEIFSDAGPDPRVGVFGQVSYYRRHVTPWVMRRLTGRSSGDGRAAKQPDWRLVEPIPG